MKVVLIFVVFFIAVFPVVNGGPLDSLLPKSVVALLDKMPDLPEVSIAELNDELKNLASNLSNLRASSTSVASSLLSAQAVHAQLSELLLYVQSIRNLAQLEIDVEERLKILEKAIRDARDQVGKIGKALEDLLKDGGGTDELLSKLTADVKDFLKSLSFLDVVSGLDISDILGRLRLFGSAGILSSPMEIVNEAGQKVFEIIDDLAAADLSAEKVLQIVDLRGGFGVPINLPGNLGEVDLSREGFNQQFLDLGNNKLSGAIGEKLGLNTDINLPGLGSVTGNLDNVFDGQGEIDLKKLGGDFANNLNLNQIVDLGKLGSVTVGGGSKNSLGGGLSLETGIGEFISVGSSGSGIDAVGPLGDVGDGRGGSARLDANVDLKDLTSHLGLIQESSGGGGLNLGDNLSIGGGRDQEGLLISNLDLKNLTSKTNVFNQSGAGGNVVIGSGSASGGVGETLEGMGYFDLKKGIAGVDLLAKAGIDGNIKLPGNLGGLVYDIQDLTEVAGHIDIRDLSKLSLDILKQTDILAIVDLPGDKLDDIRIEAHPKIDTSKLGQLNVLKFASDFAEDVKSITEFNMLSEINLVKAITSGTEFLARLDILDALREDIGSIVALPEVAKRVKTVLRDMESIFACLKRVKIFPINVRALGEALGKFNVDELLVKLPQLEALSMPTSKEILENGGDFVADMVKDVEEKLKIEERAAEAIPNAAHDLSSFQLGAFLEAADMVDKITGTVNNMVKVEHITGAGSKIRESLAGITTGLGAISAISQIGDVVQSISGVDLEKLLQIANIAKIDMNDIGNLSTIMNLTNLDETLRVPLENLIKIANLQEVELNELLDIAELAKLNLNDIDDLSDILDTDLEDLNLFDSALTDELDRMLLEPLEDIVVDKLGNAIIDIDLRNLDLADIIDKAFNANLDINDLADLDKIADLTGLNGGTLEDMEKLVRAANWNGIDLTEVPTLATLSNLDLKVIEDVQKLVGNSEVGKALEVLDVREVAKALSGVAGSTASDVSNLINGADLSGALGDVVSGLGKINPDKVSHFAAGVLKSDLASEMAARTNTILKLATGGRRLRSLKRQRNSQKKY
eukprot:GHVS01051496.1.p1 GENE.GHVS01051496.1~~GHVS01051496.1.p1  ORF type:complete len:1085 (+),score=171.37 GHVS01051496.1:284-3538(+)